VTSPSRARRRSALGLVALLAGASAAFGDVAKPSSPPSSVATKARATTARAASATSATAPAAGSAAAAPAPLPAGHPDVAPDDGNDDSAAPDDGSGSLPQGHPGTGFTQPPPDKVAPAADLPPGDVEVHLVDPKDKPLPATHFRLAILRQDVATGDSKEERDATTDGAGAFTFRDLARSSSYSYRVLVPHDAATYASESFHLDETAGRRVLVHVFPVTRDLREALVGIRGVLFVEPREDVFHIEANFQVLNVGGVSWVPEGVHIELPEGAKAFRAADSMNDARVERNGSGPVELLGTFSPGQHEVGFTFQLDNHHDSARTFRIELPPHVAEIRVVAEAGKGTSLVVDGFPDAEPMQGQDGSRLLVTGRQLARGEPALDKVSIALADLPVPSAGRWYAVALAFVVAIGGVLQALRRKNAPGKTAARSDDAEEASELILDELVSLERAHRAERIGPRTYAETRVELLDALARIAR
jgi:hypothetical protein